MTSGTTSRSRASRTAGWVVTGVVVAFTLFDAVTHLVNPSFVAEATALLGQKPYMPYIEGVAMLICLAFYLVPRTALLGATLLTGYFGGAMAVNLSTGQPVFNTVFAFSIGVLAWLGLWLRDTRVRNLYT